MSYFATTASASSATTGGEQERSAPGYLSMGDELPRPGRTGDDDETANDEALARALARELEESGLAPKEAERDEEVALALQMAYEEEARAEYEAVRTSQHQQQHNTSRDTGPHPPPYPPPPGARDLGPQKQQVDTASVAQSMFDRLMAPFRQKDDSSELQKKQIRRQQVERFRQRRAKQASMVMNVMEVVVPDFIETENFLVMKPDGTVSKIHVPEPFLRPPFYITYEGEPLMTAPPRILDDAEQNAAFIDYYRFDPIEIEAEVNIIPGPRTLGGLELVSQPEGVFVKWGVFPLPPAKRHDDDDEAYGESDDDYMDEYTETEILETNHLICAGDLIVQVDDVPTSSLESLRAQVQAMRMGSKVNVRVLRKPPPIVRCPMGHQLRLDDPRADPVAECDSCRMAFGRHHCVECGFSLCWPCHQIIYAHSKARFPRPVNNDHDFVEAPRSVRLTFSPVDVGVKVLIYWYTTAEWWIGQVESFDPLKGHTLVYEERNGNKGMEIVPDFTVREYRILTECVLNDDVATFHRENLRRESMAKPKLAGASMPVLPMDDLLSETIVNQNVLLDLEVGKNSSEPLLDTMSSVESQTPTSYATSAASLAAVESRPGLVGMSEGHNLEDLTWSTPSQIVNTPEVSTAVNVTPADDEKVVLNEAEAALLQAAMEGIDDYNDDDEGPP